MDSASTASSVQDQIAMYKGMLNIIERERQNQLHDSTLLMEENERKITDLRSEIQNLRVKLSMKEKGATAEVAMLLQENKPLQLILQNKSLEEMKHYLLIRNAEQKQYLNKLTAKTTEAKEKLLTTTLELNKLENENGKDEGKEDHRQTLQNRIQELDAKTNSWNNIENLYLKAINFLRMEQADNIAILEDSKENVKLQQICIMRAVEMGQFATEELTNLREECQKREVKVRENIEMHLKGIQALQSNWNNLIKESESLVREESVAALSKELFKKKSEDETELQKQVHQLNDLLQSMCKAILVPGFDDIFPRMLEQMKQNEKLLEDLELNDNLFDLLPKKITHAKLILEAAVNEGEGNSALFTLKRDNLLKELEETNEQLEVIDRERQELGNLIIQMKCGIACIWVIAEKMPLLTETEPPKSIDRMTGTGLLTDPLYYLQQLTIKANNLGDILYTKISDEERTRIISHTAQKLIKIPKVDEVKETANVLIHDVDDDEEDPSVPSRADIKAESKRIYDLATTNPFA